MGSTKLLIRELHSKDRIAWNWKGIRKFIEDLSRRIKTNDGV